MIKKEVDCFINILDNMGKELVDEVRREFLKTKLIDFFYDNKNDKEIIELFESLNEFGYFKMARMVASIYERYKLLLNLKNKYPFKHNLIEVDSIFKSVEYLSPFCEDDENIFLDIVFTALTTHKSLEELTKNLTILHFKNDLSPEAISIKIFKSYGQILLLEKAFLAEVFYFKYGGIIRMPRGNSRGSRPFCINLVKLTAEGKRWHINEIIEMDNGELKPVFLFCGGWGCHHDWEPDAFYEYKNKLKV
ncbi:MAG: hypothetical protein NTX22_13480 [Ignavibacteriales bacterium]|nr:hypothetical protein [Ignavibacteriales bacterium]